MGKVLLIAHNFPPIASSGSFRPAKFVKYLPQFDWQPLVLATEPGPGDGTDQTLLADLPEQVPVWRLPTPAPRPVAKLERWQSRILRNGYNPTGQNGCGADAPGGSAQSRWLHAMLAPLRVVEHPPVDQEIYWALRIVPAAVRLIQQHKVDLIMTTSAPWSSLISGLLLQRLTGRPWVADMRDPWTSEEIRYVSRGWRRMVDLRVERLCLQHADAVIGVTAKWLADLRQHAGDRNPERFVLITNGYDPDDFPAAPPLDVPGSGEVICSYVGSMFKGALIPLLEALESLDAATLARLRFELVGYIHPHDQERLQRSPVAGRFDHHPQRVSHPQALARMRHSHVLLLPLPMDYYPGKLFEYMRVGRPVLAIVPPGQAAEVVRRCGIGCVVDRADRAKLATVLCQIAYRYPAFVSHYYRPDAAVLAQFDRRVLTQKLVAVFEQVLQK